MEGLSCKTIQHRSILHVRGRTQGGHTANPLVVYVKGIYKPGEIVHHKIPIDPTNINNPDITLNWNNLQYVCRDCHAKIHDRKNRRYKIDEMGRVIT